MGQYVYLVVTASIFCAVLVSLCPGGEGGRLCRFVSFIGALAITLTMLSPLPDLLKKDVVLEGPKYTESKESGKNSAEYYAVSCGMALCEIYKTELSDINAVVTCRDSGEIERIELFVKGDFSYSEEEAGKALSEIYGIEIDVREEG